MAISQRITWTLLPNGTKGANTLRASVYISPRLSISTADIGGSEPNLSHFSDWLAWPQRILAAGFSVRVGNSAPVPAARVSPDPHLDYWQALFPPSTLVQPYDFAGSDFSGKVVLSYPVATIVNNVRAIYGQFAAIGGEMPRADQVEFLAVPSREYRDLINSLLSLGGNPFDSIRPPPGIPTIAAPPTINRSDLFTALNLLTLFHRPLNKEVSGSYTKKVGVKPPDIHENVSWRAYNRVALPTSAELADKVDFHRIVASLAQYYQLLRLTGLVVDLEFARPASDGDYTIQVFVDWHPDHSATVATEADLRPRLRTTLNGSSFVATPRDPMKTAIVDRFLRLRKVGPEFYPRPIYFELFEMDADGAGMKLKNFLLGWQAAQGAQSYDDETDASTQTPPVTAPSLRSGGIMLANRVHDTDVSTLFARNKTLNSQSTAEVNNGSGDPASDDALLYAEDVVRGYRADIHDFTRKRWFSLNLRDATYTFQNNGKSLATRAEEGMARLAAATSTDGANADIVKVHEAVFTWRGWSLAAPEPGNSLLADIAPDADTSKPENVVGSGEAVVPDGLPLKADFTVSDGTLPSLRFGRSYAVRVRLTDLAGESAPFTADDSQPDEAVSDQVVYRRYEPIESPALALVRGPSGLEKPAEGESMGRLAIRSFNDTPAKNTVPVGDRARRHIVPPRVTHRFAETHGVMDAPDGKVNPHLYGMLKQRDYPLDEETWKSADGSTLTYAAADETFTLPYLPDPWALGVVFKVDGMQGIIDPQKLYPVPLYDTGFAYSNTKRPDWPNAKPFTIVITETGPAEPAFDPAKREFHVSMPKGERARVRVSSLLPTPAILSMAVTKMIIDQKLPQAELDKLGIVIAAGQHWMFTPWRVIELVHAVQKPLIRPAPTQLTVYRDLGSVHAVPSFVTPLHSKSTAKIDLGARWIEPNDDPAQLVLLPAGYTGNKQRIPGAVGQPDLTPADPGIVKHAAHAYELKIARLAAINNTFKVGGPPDPNASAEQRPQHVFGDTHYRRVFYKVTATTRFREYMPPAIQNDPSQLIVTSDEARTWVPSSAAPPTPKLLYVVPTFGWGRATGNGQSRSWRSGGGLRVYLNRPWFATGFTEMLAVVLPPGPVFHNWAPYGDAQALPPYVTQWGADPVWVSGQVQTVAPQPQAFPLAKWRAPITFEGADAFPADEGSDLPPGNFAVAGLRVPEMLESKDVDPTTPGELAVAPHAVGYDAERQLWYADIVVLPGKTYFPFIRLALARYNPISVAGAHLSSIVMAEFVQLTPDRLAIVTQNDGKVHVAIYGIGTSAPANAGSRGGLFEIVTETLAPGADPDLGWQRSDAPGASGLADPKSDPSPPPVFTGGGNIYAEPILGGPTAAAAGMLARGEYADLLKRPDLLATVAPPFLWQGDADVPAVPPGTRVRLVITESEVFQTAEPGQSTTLTNSRVVYVETVELAPQSQIRTPPPVMTPPLPKLRPQQPPVMRPPIERPPPSQPPIMRPPIERLPPPQPPPPVVTPPVRVLPQSPPPTPPVMGPPVEAPLQPLQPLQPPERTPPPTITAPPGLTPPVLTPSAPVPPVTGPTLMRPLPQPVAPTPPPGIRPLATANFAGEWDAMKGRQGPYRWRLEQRGNIVTGTYAPLNAIINGTVDNSGRLSFTWVEHNTRNAPSASGRGYLVLVTPNEWQGRWWPGNSLVDPTPNQPNTWHATRSSTPPVQTPPNLRYPLPRLRKP